MRNMKERTCSFFRLKHWNNARGAFTIDITQEHWNAAKHTEAKPNKHTLSHTMAFLAVTAFHPVLSQLGDSHMHTHITVQFCVWDREAIKWSHGQLCPLKNPIVSMVTGDKLLPMPYATRASISHPYTHVNILFKGEVCNLSLIYRDTHSQIYFIQKCKNRDWPLWASRMCTSQKYF